MLIYSWWKWDSTVWPILSRAWHVMCLPKCFTPIVYMMWSDCLVFSLLCKSILFKPRGSQTKVKYCLWTRILAEMQYNICINQIVHPCHYKRSKLMFQVLMIIVFVCFAGSKSELSVFANQENLSWDACIWVQEQFTARTRLVFTICTLHTIEGLSYLSFLVLWFH